jgi:DEAD/DEAH box helicase domain-containing protein
VSKGNFVVLDVETQKGFGEVDRKKLHLLKVSVACIYDSATDQYLAFEERELSKMEEYLKKADLIIGFNIRDFDFEVIQPYMLTDLKALPLLDILVEFEKVRGHRISLQSVAQATLNSSKSGSGLDAIEHFKEGRMEELKKYCIDDVRITKEIFDYGVKHGKIKFISNRDYQTHDVPVSWANACTVIKEQKKEENAFPTSLF